MTAENPEPTDSRSTQQVVSQFRKLREIKRDLVKEGTVNGDATPRQVLQALRDSIPEDLFL